MSEELGQPICTEASVSVSVGGKVQIVKYEYTADFHYSMSRKYSVPSHWSEQDVTDFQMERTIALRTEIEPVAQSEMDDLVSQRDG